MAKIYTSYKYKDEGVCPIQGIYSTTARDYVDLLQNYLEAHEHINKGEENNEDLSHLSEDRITELLYERIYDSTITIVLISKNMRENKSEKDQWIYREISYSLSEHSRGERTSHTNAVLAVVIPDENGSYGYFIQDNVCCRRWPMCPVFEVIGKNMFNHKNPSKLVCEHGEIHTGENHSYIHLVKWDDFINNGDVYLNHAVRINENINDYNITKKLE